MGFLIVFIGAGIGGALRHGVNLLAVRLFGYGFPFGTFMVNVAGSLIMGILAGYFASRTGIDQHWRLFFTTGVLGGFTTFSAFSLDAILLYERGSYAAMAFYVLGSVLIALLAFVAGLSLFRYGNPL